MTTFVVVFTILLRDLCFLEQTPLWMIKSAPHQLLNINERLAIGTDLRKQRFQGKREICKYHLSIKSFVSLCSIYICIKINIQTNKLSNNTDTVTPAVLLPRLVQLFYFSLITPAGAARHPHPPPSSRVR